MSKNISDFRRRTLDANAMLRLPVGPEYWGFAGPHQQHDPAPMELVPVWNWLADAARTIAGWITAKCRRAVYRQGRSIIHRSAMPPNEATL